MTRPLVVTDCDEVLLHMVRHFHEWVGAEHGIAFELNANPFSTMVWRDGVPLPDADKWRYLDLFFDTEMDSQTAIAGAVDAIAELQREADVVVLTNLGDRYHGPRTAQLRGHGITVPVHTNQGPKGPALQRIVAHYAPSRAVFVDDLAHHLASAAEIQPHVARLHLCGEPAVAPHIPCALAAGHAHARLDTWAEALPWVLETLHGDRR